MTKLIRPNEVMERVPLKRTAIYAHIKAKTFPAPVKIGGPNGASAWRVDELDAWLQRISDARVATVIDGGTRSNGAKVRPVLKVTTEEAS